ncbi:MAG: hypothetical protein B9S27_02000 [Opitutia bacterium Tous-C8FEB]|nr:MAG: hypothetical protein B9S27_02000 [Opitutae bacterium Tous-C8FEB]
MADRPFNARLRACLALIGVAALAGLFAGATGGCGQPKPSAASSSAAAVATIPAKSADCRACHEDIYRDWAGSHHALAHRAVDAPADATAVGTPQRFNLHGVDYEIRWEDGKPTFTERRGNGDPGYTYAADFVIGHTPLLQYVVPGERGAYQAAELAWDPQRKEWFNVFADERRRLGEWGHWRGRGMNWNSMCAHCHLTDYRKNYDLTTDTYRTTFREQGVGCYQCHGDLPESHFRPRPSPPGGRGPGATAAELQRAQETCAPCHARNELLTGRLEPGGSYHDHYRLTLPTEANVFYPDGQVRDEDFNYTSLLTSRMGGKAGVTCLDCHDAHSGKTILPVQDNSLCLQCHGPSPRGNAPIIDPIAHSHHLPGSTGGRCVECHMPRTTYMQRDPRHDHGFTKPDPLLTKELGIPNACNRCHTDRSVDWAIEHAEKWYGPKLENRQRQRTRVVAAAQAGQPGSLDRLLEFIANEDVPAWRATLLLLTRPQATRDARVPTVAKEHLTHADPMVRSAAVQVLSGVPGQNDVLRPMLNDPVRLVRLDAAWPLSPELPAGSRIRQELDTYLAASADQPAGRMRLGQDFFNRGRTAEAEASLRQAVAWDPNSPGLHDTLGIVLNELGRPGEAAASLWRAAQLNPTDADAAFNAALAYAGARQLPDAELALREAVRRNPRFDRAWYNLGLLLHQTARSNEAIAALATAEQLAPRVPDYPYARATILRQQGDRAGAAAAARRVLELDPRHPQARALLSP